MPGEYQSHPISSEGRPGQPPCLPTLFYCVCDAYISWLECFQERSEAGLCFGSLFFFFLCVCGAHCIEITVALKHKALWCYHSQRERRQILYLNDSSSVSLHLKPLNDWSKILLLCLQIMQTLKSILDFNFGMLTYTHEGYTFAIQHVGSFFVIIDR